MKKLLIVLLLIPIMTYGQNKELHYNGLILSFNGQTLSNYDWTGQMIIDYLERNSHYTESFALTVDTILRTVLDINYQMPGDTTNYYDYFGPPGLYKLEADFLYIMTIDANTGTQSISKSGDVLRWQFDDTIYYQDDLPTHVLGSGNGWVILSTTDGWTGMNDFRLRFNNGFENEFPNIDMPNAATIYLYSTGFDRELPNMTLPNCVNLYSYSNGITAFDSGLSNSITTSVEDWRFQTTDIPQSELDELLQAFISYFTTTPPDRNLTLRLDVNGGVTPTASLVTQLETIYTNVGYTATITTN